MGARFLKSWITQPVKNIEEINKRLDSVEEFVNNSTGRINLTNLLDRISDIERLAVKLSNGTVNPRDFLSLKSTLSLLPNFKSVFSSFKSEYINSFNINIDDLVEFASVINRTIEEETPATIKDGGVIKNNVNGELDYFRKLLNGSEDWLQKFEAEQKEITGIKNLRVGYNRNFGYFIEITKYNL